MKSKSEMKRMATTNPVVMAQRYYELILRNRELEKVLRALEITEDDHNVWIKIQHPDMQGGVGLQLGKRLMQGQIAVKFGSIINKLKGGKINE